MKTKFLILGFLMCILVSNSVLAFNYTKKYSRGNSIITTNLKGKVVEKGTNTPVEYATVAIYNPDKKLIVGTTTNKGGEFEFGKVDLAAEGKGTIGEKKVLILEVSFIGYKKFSTTLRIDGESDAEVEKSLDKIEKNITNIELEPEAEMLSGAVVKAKRPLIEQKLDKVVMNVSESVFAANSNGFEILKKAPGITVDMDGNIKLNGKTAEIWIDDRPSNMSGTNLETLLIALQGSTIDKIEIMQHPSAKYDAQGEAGIINIKTKKNFAKGLYGNVNTSFGIRPYDDCYKEGLLSTNVNYKTQNTNSYVIASYNKAESPLEINSTTLFGNNYSLKQESKSKFYHNESYYQVKGGTDINISKKDIIGGMIGVIGKDKKTSTTDSYINYYDIATNNLLSKTLSYISMPELDNNLDANLYWTRNYDQYSKLTINADYTYYDANDKNSNHFLSFLPDKSLQSNTYYTTNLDKYINIYALKGDYRRMLGKKGTLELGAKVAHTSTFNFLQHKDSVGNNLVVNPLKENNFKYYETIAAAYGSASYQFNQKWSAVLGLRAEYTFSKGDWITSKKITEKKYLDLFPTLYIGYMPNMNYRFGLSYTRRISRPNFGVLNPIEQSIDATSIVRGDPNLKPAYTNTFSLSFGYKQWLNVSLFAQLTNDYILQLATFDNELGIKYLTFANFGKFNFMGGSISLSEIPIIKNVLYFNGNISLSYLVNEDTKNNIKEKSLFQNYSATLTCLLPKDFKLEINGNYTGRFPYGNMYMESYVYTSAGLKKDFLNKKLTLSVNATDPFRLLKSNGCMYKDGKKFYDFRQNTYMQKFSVGLTWKFGTIRATARSNERDDTQKRVD